jgi:uncharacterized protein (DUF4213/DUF364 family)
MTIINKIIDSLVDNAAIRDVRICMHATVVESIRVGLCGHTRPDQAYDVIKRQDVVANHGRLREFSAKDLARYALSKLSIEASVGVAAINSLIDIDWTKVIAQNNAEIILDRTKGKSVVIVGHFPFIERVRKSAQRLTVLGLEPGAGDVPVSEAHDVIPTADVAIISANTIANHSVDHLLSLARNSSYVILIGPSIIFSPMFFRYGVDVLLGSFIDDVDTVIRHISEGAALHHLPGLIQVAMYSKDFLGV